jgi:hypothetical protein
MKKVPDRQTFLYDSQATAMAIEIQSNLEGLTGYDYSSWRDLTITINIILEVIGIVAFVILFWKVYKLQTLVLLLIPPTETANFSVPKTLIHSTFKKTKLDTSIKTVPSQTFDFHVDTYVPHQFLQIVVLLIISALLICIIVKMIQKRRNCQSHWTTSLYFNIVGQTDMLTIKGQILPDDLINYTFFSSSPIQDLQIVGWIFPQLKFCWNIEIRHEFLSNPVEFKNIVSMNWIQAIKVRKILT